MARMGGTLRPVVATTAIIALAAAVGCSGGSSGGGFVGQTSNPQNGVFAGQVVDDSGRPISGAIVSVDGIEADELTDQNGRFVVNDPDGGGVVAPVVAGRVVAAATVEAQVTVYKPGTEGGVFNVDFATGSLPSLSVVRNELAAGLDIVSPHPGAVFGVPTSCPNPAILVEGFASLKVNDSLAVDLCVVIDKSGSAAQEAVSFDVEIDEIPETAGLPQTVLGAECAGAMCLIDSLDLRFIRVAVVAFSDRGRTRVVTDFIEDRDALMALIADIPNDPEQGGTDYSEAFLAVADLYDDQEAEDAANEQNNATEDSPAPKRICAFLSDGIPTSPFGSNLSQEKEDRTASTDAASDLLAPRNIVLNGYAIIRENEPQGKLSTLPACVCITGGDFFRIEDAEDLAAALCGQAFTEVIQVVCRNLDVPNSEVVAELRPDGFFSALVAVTDGGGEQDNTIEIEIVPEDPDLTATSQVTIRLISEALLGGQGFDVISIVPVADAGIVTPQGDAPGNDLLETFLGNEFPDALQLRGVESFVVPGLAGTNVSVQVDILFEEAGFDSDFGFFTFDPDDPPETVAEALATAQFLFTTDGFDPPGGVVAHGDFQFAQDLPADTALGFFIVPNDTLANAIAGTARNDPLFTVPSLNPGGLAQVLAFSSEDGRVGANHPDVTILAFEDLTIAERDRSDRDFNDIVFSVSFLRPSVPAVICTGN